MIDKYIIVDDHAHIYPKKKAKWIINTFADKYRMNPVHLSKGTIDDLTNQMTLHGIDYTVLANFASPKIISDNNLWTLEIAAESKKVIPLIAIHPEMKGDKIKLLEEYIDKGAKGIKIHSSVLEFDVQDKRLTDVFEFCNERKFPIVYHCGVVSNVKYNDYADLNNLLPIIDKYTNIPTLLTHMAEGKTYDIISLADKYEHIYFDTSICISGLLCIDRCHDMYWQNDENVIKIINKIGSNRILFGSDYPFGSPIHDVRRLLNLNISDNDKSKIVGLNAIKFFNIKISNDYGKY